MLFDVDDRRGWLVDGAIAVFYMLKVQLKHLKPYISSEMLQVEQLENANAKDGYDSGYNALLNVVNRELPIFDRVKTSRETTQSVANSAEMRRDRKVKVETTTYSVEDLVNENCHVLEEIFDYQKMKSSVLHGTTREKLEGFDFMDIADKDDPITPRVVVLEPSSRGLSHLTQKINAVNLFGTRFGEVIVPAEGSNTVCHHWRSLPKGKDYIAATVEHLSRLHEKSPCRRDGVVQLASDVLWHQPNQLFESCDCKGAKWMKSCDRSQTLLPKSIGSKRGPDVFNPKYSKGAVIFGRKEKGPSWLWPENPSQDPIELTDENALLQGCPATETFDDSGLGTSVTTDSQDRSGTSHSPTPEGDLHAVSLSDPQVASELGSTSLSNRLSRSSSNISPTTTRLDDQAAVPDTISGSTPGFRQRLSPPKSQTRDARKPSPITNSSESKSQLAGENPKGKLPRDSQTARAKESIPSRRFFGERFKWFRK